MRERDQRPGKAWRKQPHRGLAVPIWYRQASPSLQLDLCRRAWLATRSLDAIELALRVQAPPPQWLAKAVSELLIVALRAPAKLRALERSQRADAIHLARAEFVDEAIELGLTWERACMQASDRLAKTEAVGSPETVAKSYATVKNAAAARPDRFLIPPVILEYVSTPPLGWDRQTDPDGAHARGKRWLEIYRSYPEMEEIRAAAALSSVLADGPKLYSERIAPLTEPERAGLSVDAIETARRRLGVRVLKRGTLQELWHLPAKS
jgi:hypothetical protein